MGKIKSVSKIDARVTLELTEEEARALYNIVGYGHKPFTEWFYTRLGKYYLQPHERGLISLFETIKGELPQHLKRIDNAREAFKK
jgi:phage anti-repressor protein